MRRSLGTLTVSVACALALTACAGGEPAASTDSPASRDAETSQPIHLVCHGDSGPVVVLETGLDEDIGSLQVLDDALSSPDVAAMRVCRSERAGIGASPPLGADGAGPSPARAADQLLAALDQVLPDERYVVVGWSYGGMVAQAFADRHADRLAGVVLLDSAVPEQFTDRFFDDVEWVDGGRPVDQEAAREELRTLDLGDVPLVVVTQGEATGEFRRVWFGYQDRLAALSTNAVNVVAADAGHALHEDALDLVTQAVAEAAAGGTLTPCDDRFTPFGGRCR